MNVQDEDNYSSLIMYKDYTFVMHVAMKKTYTFYYKLKLFLTIMNIILSASLSAIDGAYINNVNDVKLLENKVLNNMNIVIKAGMVINFVLCITMGLIYLFEIAQKEVFFRIYADNYLRLHNTVVTELSLNKTSVSRDFIKFVLFEFNFLMENAKYDVPSFIKKRIKIQFQNYSIPPYLDVYINNFRYTSEIYKYKDYCYKCLSAYLERYKKQMLQSVQTAQQAQIMQTAQNSDTPNIIVKSYSYDHLNIKKDRTDRTDRVLSSVVIYNNENSNLPVDYSLYKG